MHDANLPDAPLRAAFKQQQQRAVKLLLMRAINRQSFWPTHNQEYPTYFDTWVRRRPEARAHSGADAVVDDVRGLCFHRTEAGNAAIEVELLGRQ